MLGGTSGFLTEVVEELQLGEVYPVLVDFEFSWLACSGSGFLWWLPNSTSQGLTWLSGECALPYRTGKPEN